MKTFAYILAAGLALGGFAHASELSTAGINVMSDRIEAEYDNRQQIARVLEAESRMRTVGDAMAVKATGLQYVYNLSDFELLASFSVNKPSEAYRNAVAEFIAQHVGNYIQSMWDVEYLRILEFRVITVKQAMEVKKAGLKVVRNVRDFLEILPFSSEKPSDAYRTAVSNFVATYISTVVSSRSRIPLILQAEGYALTVGDAMKVKNAGLVAVHNKGDLLDLAQYTVPSPSPAYQNAVQAFIRDNIGRYP